MAGDLNTNNHRVKNLNNKPTTGTDGVNKNYVDSVVAKSHVKPSHFRDQFAFLMSNAAQWTDEIGNSFIIAKIADLSPSQGNFHTYNQSNLHNNYKKFSRWLQVQNVT